jgi:Spy/CpxP family protein refolding chaperone
MKRLALAALSVTVLSSAIAPATFAFNDRLESGFTAARQNLGSLNNQTVPGGVQETMAQNAPIQEDCLTKQETTALNDRFDRARRDNLDLALNDRFDRARRDNLDLALNDRFDEARRRNLNS